VLADEGDEVRFVVSLQVRKFAPVKHMWGQAALGRPAERSSAIKNCSGWFAEIVLRINQKDR
jgi:hypothetical protein